MDFYQLIERKPFEKWIHLSSQERKDIFIKACNMSRFPFCEIIDFAREMEKQQIPTTDSRDLFLLFLKLTGLDH